MKICIKFANFNYICLILHKYGKININQTNNHDTKQRCK